MHPYSLSSQQELRLRMHIREILLPYARTHLTTDHVAFTECAVEDLLLRSLQSLPLADATAFFLPTDPFDDLVRSLDGLSLKPYEERWTAPAEIIPYIKSFFPPLPPSCALRDEKCWVEEDREYEKLAELSRPMSPVLTARARRNTPQLGGTKSRESVPRTKSALSVHLRFESVSVDDIVEPPAQKVDEVLDLRCRLDASAQVSIRLLFQSVLKSSTEKAALDLLDKTPMVDGFLRCESPPITIHRLASPPLFSRRAQSGRGMTRTDDTERRSMQGVLDVAPLVKRHAPVEPLSSESDNVNGRHLEIVDGWTASTISSPPPPSGRSPSPSDIDELWEVSPPGTPATSLIAAKMEEIEIPRVRKFGYGSQKPEGDSNDGGTANLFAARKSSGPFIKSLVSTALVPTTHTTNVTPSNVVPPGVTVPSSLRPSACSSLEGQPPSILAEGTVHTGDAAVSRPLQASTGDEMDLDETLVNVYASTPRDPASYVLDEKLDEGQIMLMDVPELPPPTHHPREPAFFPDGTCNFVGAINKGGLSNHEDIGRRSACAKARAFLRPVKGIKPLALDLSWRPFNFGKSIPTNEEVARVEGALRLEDNSEFPSGIDKRQQVVLQELVENASLPRGKTDVDLRGCERLGTSPVPRRIAEGNREQFEYVLTNRERLRISRDARSFGHVRSDEDDQAGDRENEPSHDKGESGSLERSENKAARCERDKDARCIDDGEDVPIDRSVNPRDDHHPSHESRLDDSGVAFHMDHGFRSFGMGYLRDSAAEDHQGNMDDFDEDKENVTPCGHGYNDVLDAFQSPGHGANAVPNRRSSRGVVRPLNNTLGHDTARARVLGPILATGRQAAEVDDVGSPRLTKRRRLEDLVPSTSRDLFEGFVGLRNQVRISATAAPQEHALSPPQGPSIAEESCQRTVPDELLDSRTVQLPPQWILPTTWHRYLGSMAFIQKRALVRQLESDACRVSIVERYQLGGVDIVVDPDHAVVFAPLLALPATIEPFSDTICSESWRYSHILVIFEAYPSTRSNRSDGTQNARLAPYAYSPPVCKAVKKLRRLLSIAEGCGTKDEGCSVIWAFANDPKETARFVRCFGEEAYATALSVGNDVLWEEREWLEEDELEDEASLAAADGMNSFSARIMLYQRSLQEVLDLSSEARLEEFGELIGRNRVAKLNGVIEKQMQAMVLAGTDSVLDYES